MTPGRTRARAVKSGAVLALALVALVALAGCTGGPVLANAPVVRPSPAATPVPTPARPDPQPIVLPRDDGPHGRLTEWWYYTGHLRDVASGRRYGFEFVVFRAERGDFPVSWASHLAITDESGGRFLYAQRSEIGPQVDGSPRGRDGRPTGFAFSVAPSAMTAPTAAAPSASGTAAPSASGTPGSSASAPAAPAASASGGGAVPDATPWTMTGSDGHDRLSAIMGAQETVTSGSAGRATGPSGLALALVATRAPTLHRGDGWVDFGPAGGSYYYSRTRVAATGELTVDGRTLRVDGSAWFDHQWGDFISVGGGGWDWFAIELPDGSDLMLSLVRDAQGGYPLVYGTLVRADGTTRDLAADAFSVAVGASWRSPRTGATYPARWTIAVPSERLIVELTPTVADQELDTRATTGVVYWEGSQRVVSTIDGRRGGGEAYVELTGYAP